jgi:Trk K+ transport system NAD-binding subunit
MYVVIAGGGKVGWNLARELIDKGHEVTLIEQTRRRYLTIEEELEHAVQYGDGTESPATTRTTSSSARWRARSTTSSAPSPA